MTQVNIINNLSNMQEIISESFNDLKNQNSVQSFEYLNQHWNILKDSRDKVRDLVLNLFRENKLEALLNYDLAKVIYELFYNDFFLNNDQTFYNIFHQILSEVPYLECYEHYGWGVGNNFWDAESSDLNQYSSKDENINPVKILNVNFPKYVVDVKEYELDELSDKLEKIFMVQNLIQPKAYIRISQEKTYIRTGQERTHEIVNIILDPETGKFSFRRDNNPMTENVAPEGNTLKEMLVFTLYHYF